MQYGMVGLGRMGGNMAEATLVIDLVCGQVVDADFTKHHSDYDGGRYFFCCEHCQATFDLEPERYVRSQRHGPYH